MKARRVASPVPSSRTVAPPAVAALLPLERIERTIIRARSHNVIIASDLASIYGVEPRVLNQAVKRNAARFPRDFAFRLSRAEAAKIVRSRSQTVILNRGGNIKYAPLVFTEHGAVMAATVLNSARAVQISIVVVRAFLRMRHWIAGHAALAARLDDLEKRVGRHDSDLSALLRAVRDLLQPPRPPRRRIGFSAR